MHRGSKRFQRIADLLKIEIFGIIFNQFVPKKYQKIIMTPFLGGLGLLYKI